VTEQLPQPAFSEPESVPSILETQAVGEIADIYSDIRRTLRTSVVNLVWRHLATMPGALPWAWSTVRPLYSGAAIAHAEAVRHALVLPGIPGFSSGSLAAAGIGPKALRDIRNVLDSYHHTNALALVVLSALLDHYDPGLTDAVEPFDAAPVAVQIELPPLPPMATLPPGVQRLIEDLNGFGEDSDPFLIASMYKHLAYWPPYLAMARTMLAPLQADGSLNALTRAARALGRAHGHVLSRQLAPARPPGSMDDALAACKRFVEHPIARMTGICAIIRRATPDRMACDDVDMKSAP
jgi:hypothetical protein